MDKYGYIPIKLYLQKYVAQRPDLAWGFIDPTLHNNSIYPYVTNQLAMSEGQRMYKKRERNLSDGISDKPIVELMAKYHLNTHSKK